MPLYADLLLTIQKMLQLLDVRLKLIDGTVIANSNATIKQYSNKTIICKPMSYKNYYMTSYSHMTATYTAWQQRNISMEAYREQRQ